ncbi:MAG: DNA primase [Oscillospiraceae bacterium]|nr:DNA primase [Oscillospiraceae bacterium]
MAFYSDEIIDEIKNHNDIVDAVSQYITLKRSGRGYFGLCPFHKEDTPSFSVSPERQIFHCFGCGVGGDVIRFVGKIENLGFKETIEMMAEKSGIILPTSNDFGDNGTQQLKQKIYEMNKKAADFYHENLYKPTAKIAQEYVKKRKLDNKTLKAFLIGYSGNLNELYKHLNNEGFTEEEILASGLVNKNEQGKFIDRFRKRLMFPILDVRGRVIAFGGRVLDDSLPKYINSSDNLIYNKGRNLYGLNLAKNSKSKKIIMVEGYMDAVSLYQRGVDNVVASLGTALTEAQGRLLRNSEQVIIAYDSDGAGQAATIRGLEILQNLGLDVRILQMGEAAKDPDEYIIKYGSAGFNKLVEEAISLVEFKVKVLRQTVRTDNLTDRIKFLNEIAKILSMVQNNIEQEVYIDKISTEYKISKEAIYAEINKLKYGENKGAKVLDLPKVSVSKRENKVKTLDNKLEDLVLKLLINEQFSVYEKIKDIISPEDFKSEINKIIVETLYNKFEENSQNISDILNLFEDEQVISKVTEIMAVTEEIADVDKMVNDVIKGYTQNKLINDRNEIIEKLKDTGLNREEVSKLENELNKTIIKLAENK